MGPRIALTGGIACGKSLFAKFLAELGIQLLDADDVVHELEAPNGVAVPLIRAAFGEHVVDAKGGIDRARLAAIVFSDTLARKKLEGILFPLVRARLQDFVLRGDSPHAASGDSPHIVSGDSPRIVSGDSPRIAVIPLLFESHWESDYDIILCIASPEHVQIDRMMATRGYTRAQALARLAAQMPVHEKMARSHLSVMNDSTSDKLKVEAKRVVAWLQGRFKDEYRRK